MQPPHAEIPARFLWSRCFRLRFGHCYLLRVKLLRQVACVSDVIDMRARIGVHDLPARRHDPPSDMEATMRSDSRAGRI
jgi:hypothetical protein